MRTSVVLPLDAFEKFAVELEELFGNLDLVGHALSKLLDSCERTQIKDHASEQHKLAVADWCLDADALRDHDAHALARLLMLEREVSSPDRSASVQETLLARAPLLLESAPDPVARRLARSCAEGIEGPVNAGAWLRSLRESGLGPAYLRAAGAIIERHGRGGGDAADLRRDVWEVVSLAISPANSSLERCRWMQQVLPQLVDAEVQVSAEAELAVAQTLSVLVSALAADTTKSVELSDALELAVTFRGQLLRFWRRELPLGLAEEGVTLIRSGLCLGRKEHAAGRKHAGRLLQAVVEDALADAAALDWLAKSNIRPNELLKIWDCFWALYGGLDEFAAHLLKATWAQTVERLLVFFRQTADLGELPLWLPSPAWFEVLLRRAMAHDNDSVLKFVVAQVTSMDLSTVRLSDAFILEEMLPRLTHDIELLYPKSDLERLSERRVAAFFSAFVRLHCEGPGHAAVKVLEAFLEPPMMHHLPIRLILTALIDAGDALQGTIDPTRTAGLVEQFLVGRLRQAPLSARPPLASCVLRLAALLAKQACTSSAEAAAAAVAVAQVSAALSDGLFDGLRTELAAFAVRCLGDAEVAHGAALTLLRGAASPYNPDLGSSARKEDTVNVESYGVRATPMVALQLSTGAVRLVVALHGLVDLKPDAVSPCVCEDVAEAVKGTLEQLHRRPYLPRRSSIAALFSSAYVVALRPRHVGTQTDCDDTFHAAGGSVLQPDVCSEVLAFVNARASVLLAPKGGTGEEARRREEAAWLWLYAFALEQFWHPGLPFGDALATMATDILREAPAHHVARDEVETLRTVAAAAFLSVLAPRFSSADRRTEMFQLLLAAELRQPAEVKDGRFSVADTASAEPLGTWRRERSEEFEEVATVEREGLGRVLEWRDAVDVFYVAKWRALALLARRGGLLVPLETAQRLVAAADAVSLSYSGLWAVALRLVAYPVLFAGPSAAPEDVAREALVALCRGCTGIVVQCVGDAVAQPRGAVAELAAAVCDRRLFAAEAQLFGVSASEDGPLGQAIRRLLAIGEEAVGVSRAVAVPLLVALAAGGAEGSAASAPKLLASLLLLREGVIQDGALTHAPDQVAGALDVDGPAGANTFVSLCDGASLVRERFTRTSALARVLTLATLDAVCSADPGHFPPLIAATLEVVLAEVRSVLEHILRPPNAKAVANRPPTPMPWTQQHRLQLRSWQTLLVLGARADRTAAEHLISELFWHLGHPHLPDVREYQELLACLLCERFEDLAVRRHLLPLLAGFEQGAQVSASGLLVATYLFRQWTRHSAAKTPPAVASELLLAMIPYLTHNSAYVRGTAAWGFHFFVHSVGAAKVHDLLGDRAQVVLSIYEFLSTQKECVKMRARTQPLFLRFDPASRATVDCLTKAALVPSADGGEEEENTLQGACTFSDGEFHPTQIFLEVLKEEVHAEMQFLMDRTDPSITSVLSDEWRQQLERGRALVMAPPAAPLQQHLLAVPAAGAAPQRKYDPEAPARGEPAADTNSGQTAVRRPRQPLVVVASLVDKTPNLAGLCRTAEVFSCESLCMPNLKIARDQSFQSIAVSAEKWLPLKDVPPESLKDTLLDYRRRGYELVGVEQTHSSVPLHEYRFARAGTVLVLGAEKEGISSEVLPLLDACVEVPQRGQIRSLNVHVTGSLAIWEYTKQRLDV